MTYTIRDLWNDILNIDLITVGQVIIWGVVIVSIYLLIAWWWEKLEQDNPIASTLWYFLPLVILIAGGMIYGQFAN